MPVSDYTVENPLKKVQQLFEANPELTHEHVNKVYKDYFSNQENFKKIYTLNRKSLSFLQSGRLVHMRCMVQDMYNPEYFVAKYQITKQTTGTPRLHTTLYSDLLPQHSRDEEVELVEGAHMERQVFYCVPVPAETAWFKDAENKRFCGCFEGASKSDKTSIKRKKEDEEHENGGGGGDDDVEMADKGDKGDKKMKTSDDKGTEVSTDLQYKDNFPLPGETDIPAICKIYDTDLDIQLNEVIDIVGVISLHSSLDSSALEGLVDDVEWKVHNPHPLIVPRIHVILLSKHKPLQLLNAPTASSSIRMQACRERLLSLLTSLLHGDHTAALCLLCHLLSSVYVRHDVTPLGKLSLNLHNLPPPTLPSSPSHSTLLHNFLNKLVSKCHLFDMTLDNVNKSRLVPSKDYTQNRLNSAILQLSKGTHLIIDETKLQPGKLDSDGIRNMTALSEALQWQRINYDFQYHTVPFNTDVRFLILSQAKSLLKTDLCVKIETSPPSSSPPPSSSLLSWQQQYELLESLMSDEWWMEVRWYVMQAQQTSITIKEDVQKLVEEEFVEGRKTENMTSEHIHKLLTLARYVAMGEGSESMGVEHWDTAKQIIKTLLQRDGKLTN